MAPRLEGGFALGLLRGAVRVWKVDFRLRSAASSWTVSRRLSLVGANTRLDAISCQHSVIAESWNLFLGSASALIGAYRGLPPSPDKGQQPDN